MATAEIAEIAVETPPGPPRNSARPAVQPIAPSGRGAPALSLAPGATCWPSTC